MDNIQSSDESDLVTITRTIPIVHIFPHPKNYRQHGDDQLEVIETSLDSFGQVGTVTVKSRLDGTYVLLTGHSVYMAAERRGDSVLVCRVVPNSWTEERCLAFMVMDNKSRTLGVDNTEKLVRVLTEVEDKGLIEISGSSKEELNDLLESLQNDTLSAYETAPRHLPSELSVYEDYDPENDNIEPGKEGDYKREKAERPPVKDDGFSDTGEAVGWDEHAPAAGGDDFEVPVISEEDEEEVVRPLRTQPGDVWQLGVHRLVVSSSLDPQAVDTCINGLGNTSGNLIDLVWTDPPYGVSYVGKTKDALTIQNDKLDETNLDDFLRVAFTLGLEKCKIGAVWYVSSPPGPLMLVFGNLLKELKVLRQSIVWGKNRFVMGHNDFHYRHEFLFYGWKDGAQHYIIRDRTLDTLWLIDRPGRNADHPTMKPIPLVLRSLKYSSKTGDIVYDPFGGSGTTLIACERSKRVCRTIELSPRYADVILKRWEMDSGREALWSGNMTGLPQLEWERPEDEAIPLTTDNYAEESDAA